MSREGYEGWGSPPRSRDTDGGRRSHRRRGSGHADDRGQANGRDDGTYDYGSEAAYADQRGYGSQPHAGPEGYGTDGYGDYRGGGDAAAGYGNGYQGGYGQEQYAEGGGYADQGYAEGGYADQGYGAGGYADDQYGTGGQDAYTARDPYSARDPYGTGEYGAADPYARPDPRASGPHNMTDPRGSTDPYRRGRDPYDTGGGGYAGSDGYADGAGYGDAAGYRGQDSFGGQDGYAGQDGFAGHDPYASAAGGGYERGGYEQQDDDLYRWRDPQDAGDDPGLTRRRSSRGEGELDAEDPRHDGFFRGFGASDDDLGGRGRGSSGSRGRGGRRPPKPPKQRKSRAGLVALGVVLAIFAGIAYTGYHYYSAYKAKHASYTGSGYGHVLIMVKTGDTLDGISSQLLHKGVIEAIDPWASYVANKSGLHPGTYRVHLHMSPAAAYAALTDQKNLINSKVTIPDGMREADILPLLAQKTGIPLTQFKAAASNTAALGLPSYAQGKVEGYLYPDTYDLAPGETALKLLQTMVAQFNTEVASIHLIAAANQAQFTPAQIITGASLLEAETSSKYWSDVARVIDNRLNRKMPLGLDATVAYELGVHTDKLTTSQLTAPNPYNTRVNTGLPPGPIDSPTLTAIEAFLHPTAHSATTDQWLYFVTVDKSGTTYFTGSNSQFQTWVALAKKNGVI